MPWRLAPAYPSTADDDVTIVNYRGLSGGDRALRFMQTNPSALILKRGNGRRRAGMAITNLHCRIDILIGKLTRNPIRRLAFEFVATQILNIAHNYAICLPLQIYHVPGPGLPAGNS